MKKIIFLLMILMVTFPVSSLEFSSDYDSNIVVKGVTSEIDFVLNVENASSGIYNLYSLAEVFIEPSANFNINEGSIEKDFVLKTAKSLSVGGYYTFVYTLNQRGVEKFNEQFTINILELGEVLEISSDSINPDLDTLKFYVKNKENVKLENLSVKFSSILFDVDEVFDLEPFEKKEFSVYVGGDIMKKTKAGVYIIESFFETDDGIKRVDGNLYLGEKKGISTAEDASGFLIRTQTVMKVNAGNVLETVEIKIKKNIFSRLFTNFNVEPSVVDRKGFFVEYTWIKERLGPTENFIVKAKTSYIIPFFIFVLLGFALMGYERYAKTKIEVKKSVSPVRTKNGEFALKIKLSLKSRSNVENVSVIDRIPAIVKIYNKFGMIKPDKIDAVNRRIHWNIGDLNAGEERVFNYIVYSKVGIVGKFSLPSTLAVFEKNGQIHEVESNKVFFMNEQVKG